MDLNCCFDALVTLNGSANCPMPDLPHEQQELAVFTIICAFAFLTGNKPPLATHTTHDSVAAKGLSTLWLKH